MATIVKTQHVAGYTGVMAFHAAAPPSSEINMTLGNPIRISVQQGFDDPSIPQAEALASQVLIITPNDIYMLDCCCHPPAH